MFTVDVYVLVAYSSGSLEFVVDLCACLSFGGRRYVILRTGEHSLLVKCTNLCRVVTKLSGCPLSRYIDTPNLELTSISHKMMTPWCVSGCSDTRVLEMLLVWCVRVVMTIGRKAQLKLWELFGSIESPQVQPTKR